MKNFFFFFPSYETNKMIIIYSWVEPKQSWLIVPTVEHESERVRIVEDLNEPLTPEAPLVAQHFGWTICLRIG